MDNGILTALISAFVSLATVVVSYFFAKRQDRDATWRLFKIEHYKEYIGALSEIVHGRATPERRARYAQAANALALVSTPRVLTALYAFNDSIGPRSDDGTTQTCLRDLIRELRADAQPVLAKTEDGLSFRLIQPPPET